MSIFDYMSLTDYLKFWLSEQDKSGRGLKGKIAELLNTQQSYISLILRNEKSFSGDQALKLARFLDLSEEEKEYCILISNYENAQSKGLREFYSEKIREIQKEKGKGRVNISKIGTEAETTEQRLFLWADIKNFFVYTSLSLTPSLSIEEIASRFYLSKAEIEVILDELVRLKLVRFDMNNRSYKKNEGNLFLFPKNNLEKSLASNHLLQASLYANMKRRQYHDDDFFASTSFCIQKKDFAAIKKLFHDALEKSRELGQGSKTEEMFHLNLSLFKA